RDQWIVPFLDITKEDSGNGAGRQLELRCHSWDVVGEHDSPHYGRYMQYLGAGCLEFFIIHRRVRAGKIHRISRYLLYAAAGANGLIVKLGAGVTLVVVAEPLLVKGVGEGRPGAHQAYFRGAVIAGGAATGQGQQSQQNCRRQSTYL